MAITSTQRECERWIVENWLPIKFGCTFKKEKLKMQGRGKFEFDAVNKEREIVINISTASAKTYSGHIGSGKKSKLRADSLMLSLVLAKEKILILTESCMHSLAIDEQIAGRLPLDIKIILVELPNELRQKLAVAKENAARELTSDLVKGI